MPEPENKPTFVLIHGAWAGSWVWDALKPELEAAGHRVLAFDMPGNPQHPAAAEDISMAGCMAHIAAACAEIEGPLLLVGHSGGGGGTLPYAASKAAVNTLTRGLARRTQAWRKR